MPRHVGDDRPLEPDRGVVPAEAVPARVVVRVEPVTGEARQVDPADERHLLVHDDELLVVTVERPLAGVERHQDPRALDELVACPPHLAPVRVEERQRRTCPGEYAHVYPPCRIGEQLPQRRPFLLEPKGGVEVPAREVDVGARRPDRIRDPRQRLASIHEGHDTAASARRERRRACPAVTSRVDGPRAAVPPQPPHVMGADGSLDRLADEVVEAVQRVGSHGALMPAPRGISPSR